MKHQVPNLKPWKAAQAAGVLLVIVGFVISAMADPENIRESFTEYAMRMAWVIGGILFMFATVGKWWVKD